MNSRTKVYRLLQSASLETGRQSNISSQQSCVVQHVTEKLRLKAQLLSDRWFSNCSVKTVVYSLLLALSTQALITAGQSGAWKTTGPDSPHCNMQQSGNTG